MIKRKLIISFWTFCLMLSAYTAQQIKTDLVYKTKLPASGKTEKAPVIIMLHGYGSNEADLFEISNAFDGRFLFFSLRGPYPGKEMGYSWYGLDFLPQKKFQHDYQEMKESRKKILSFISHACREFKADSNKVFIMGYSQGAIMAYDVSINAPKKVFGVLALSGLLAEGSLPSKPSWADVSAVKYFIAHGYSDNIIDIKEAETASELLKEKGNKNITFNRYEMPHSISGKELNDIKSWLVKQLVPVKQSK